MSEIHPDPLTRRLADMVTFTPAALIEARRRIAGADAAPVVRVEVKDGGCAGRK